jgi:hypothetical protein
MNLQEYRKIAKDVAADIEAALAMQHAFIVKDALAKAVA